jgi:hypothetical protein
MFVHIYKRKTYSPLKQRLEILLWENCSVLVQTNNFSFSSRFNNQKLVMLRTAFRTRARLVCHLVFTFFLYVRIESCDFVSRWTPERHIRNCSFKRQMKISRSNLYLLFSDLSWGFPFVYREPEKRRFSMYFVLLNFRDN